MSKFLLIVNCLLAIQIQSCNPKRAVLEKDLHRAGDWLSLQGSFEAERQSGAELILFMPDQGMTVVLYANGTMDLVGSSGELMERMHGTEYLLPADLNAEMYAAFDGNRRMVLTVRQDSCTRDTLRLPVSASILHDKAYADFDEYAGCGLFLNSPRLHDIWALVEWNEQVDLRLFFPKGVPVLELYLSDNTFKGYDGCCQIEGRFEPKGSRASLMTLSSPCRECDGNEWASRYRAALMNIHFKLEMRDLYLTLTSQGDTLIFRKVD